MSLVTLNKIASGVSGLDDITHGGLPKGRPVLVCGSPGSGKTLLAMQFLLEGNQDGEGTVFVSFEEGIDDLRQNVRSAGLDAAVHEIAGRMRMVHMDLEVDPSMEAGAWSLDPILLRLGSACDAVSATRLALDGIDALFDVLRDRQTLRFEFTRMLRWARERGLSLVVTAERGKESLTRHGLEEYLTDCVIALEQRMEGQVATRQLRIIKYRGSGHGTNEYPFLIGDEGLSVLPITEAGLGHQVSEERVSTGVPTLDAMCGGGVYRGSTVLVSGSGGTGKSSLAASFAVAACGRGERVLYFALEEAPEQIRRNMHSIGIGMHSAETSESLKLKAFRPSSSGLEHHLLDFIRQAEVFAPRHVVIDPISALSNSAREGNLRSMLVRLIDTMKSRGVTVWLTALTEHDDDLGATGVGISSLVDTWISLRNLEHGGERTRGLYILKSRGTAHSNQVREFVLSSQGIALLEVEIDHDGLVLTGSRRELAATRRTIERSLQERQAAQRRETLQRKRAAMDARIAAMHVELDEEIRDLELALQRSEQQLQTDDELRARLSSRREQVR